MISHDFAFQFYDSPIKSLPLFFAAANPASFNSMIVRLKAHKELCNLIGLQRFNSMIVRLKGISEAKSLKNVGFQFYDSPIKRHPCLQILFRFSSFNSMIVRLKVAIK